MTALVVLDTAVVVLLGLLVVGLLRSHADIVRRLHELGAGLEDDAAAPEGAGGAHRHRNTVGRGEFNVFPEVPAPADREGFPEGRDLVGQGLADDALTIRVAGTNHRTLVAFLSSGCLTCARFWDAFSRPAELGLPPDIRVVVVTKDFGEESASKIAGLAPKELPTLASSAAWVSYDVPGSPYFVLVDGPTGKVMGEGTGLDWDQVRNLLTQATDDAAFAAQTHLAEQRVAKPNADAARESRIDDELMAAGVMPGDPSLYATPNPDVRPTPGQQG